MLLGLVALGLLGAAYLLAAAWTSPRSRSTGRTSPSSLIRAYTQHDGPPAHRGPGFLSGTRRVTARTQILHG